MENYTVKRSHENNFRFYDVYDESKLIAKVPSVTTVLGNTRDNSGLKVWELRVGKEEAYRISSLSGGRGNIMHRLIELYKKTTGTKSERFKLLKEISEKDSEINEILNESNGKLYLKQGWIFFSKFFHNSEMYFDRIEKVLSAEEFLWTLKFGGWGGTVDNVSILKDNSTKIIDYKNSIKPKSERWIEDYFTQVGAYSIAYYDRTGIDVDGAEIWIANEMERVPQTFYLSKDKLKSYAEKFVKRRQMFKDKFNI